MSLFHLGLHHRPPLPQSGTLKNARELQCQRAVCTKLNTLSRV
jgi:hypothetical protein